MMGAMAERVVDNCRESEANLATEICRAGREKVRRMVDDSLTDWKDVRGMEVKNSREPEDGYIQNAGS